MASCPRSHVFREGEVGVYHCYNRCVRQAGLFGVDEETGKSFEHRRQWIIEFEQELARLFGVEVCFHGELINHLHVVLRVRPDVVASWSNKSVVVRWLEIALLIRSLDGKTIKPLSEKRIEKELADRKKVGKTRRKLASISSFMGALCEHISRRCNAEEGKKGAFWEDRFKCKELADEASILACGVYVDLNQIRACEAQSPETSLHTSAYQRTLAWRQQNALSRDASGSALSADSPSLGAVAADGWLCELTLSSGPDAVVSSGAPATSGRRASDKGLLPIGLDEYLQLLDLTGRIVRPDKPGAIPAELPPILQRLEERGLHVNIAVWGEVVANFATRFGHVVGRSATVVARAKAAGRKWFCGRKQCEEAFG